MLGLYWLSCRQPLAMRGAGCREQVAWRGTEEQRGRGVTPGNGQICTPDQNLGKATGREG